MSRRVPKSPFGEPTVKTPSQSSSRHDSSKVAATNKALLPNYWDRLSRIYLNENALNEITRRSLEAKWAGIPLFASNKRPFTGDIKRFARGGGPDLRDVIGHPSMPHRVYRSRVAKRSVGAATAVGSRQGSRRSSLYNPSSYIYSARWSSQATTAKSRKSVRRSSPYDRNFEQMLIDNGIYQVGYQDLEDNGEEYHPANYEALKARLAEPRASLSADEITPDTFRAFKKANASSFTEADVVGDELGIILGTPKKATVPARNVGFNNIRPIVPIVEEDPADDDDEDSIAKPKPDLYDGVRPGRLCAAVRSALGPFIVPSKATNRPCLPNFFVEAKGPEGSSLTSQRQACYSGAIGARGARQLLEYAKAAGAGSDEKAWTITATYSGGRGAGSLKIYSTHVVESADPGRKVDYRMTQLGGWDMTADIETFRLGAAAMRNARDWAAERREELVKLVSPEIQEETPEDTQDEEDAEETEKNMEGEKEL